MSTAIRLVVGLGNPGETYQETRHNIGTRWVRDLASRFDIGLSRSRLYRAEKGRGQILGHDVRLLLPSTYMNNSGVAVARYLRYFRIKPTETLVVFDDVAFEPGNTRFKLGGGTNGHNGIRSIISHLRGVEDFKRLRIGVGHPGDPNMMTRYLTKSKMPSKERELAEWSSHMDDELLQWLLDGDWERVMTALHSRKPNQG